MKVTLLANDRIGPQMAGPGIRYWELAKALSARHDVTLVAPELDLSAPGITCLRKGDLSWRELFSSTDVVVAQIVTPPVLAALRRTRTRLVLDAYDPMEFETFEQNRGDHPGLRLAKERSLHGMQNLALLSADAVICASERQRDLWIGSLVALGRVDSARYDADNTLRRFVDVVPFGCPAREPQRSGQGPRALFGFADSDIVLLWGGGIWDWFDPLSIVRGLAAIADSHPHVKLVFMGVAHPAGANGGTDKARQTEALVDDLGLRGTSVFFSYGWVPYEQRQSFLLDADAGVSAHLDHIETRFSFRTRVLDYFWAGLPCITTEGDSMADLIAAEGAGLIVGYSDVTGWSRAIASIADDVEARRAAGVASGRLGRAFSWDEVAAKLDAVLRGVTDHAAPRRLPLAVGRELARYVSGGALAVARDGGVAAIARRVRAGSIF